MKKLIMYFAIFAAIALLGYEQSLSLTITSPKAGDSYRYGRTIVITWDTTGTNSKVFQFYWAREPNASTWNLLPLPKGKTELTDKDSKTNKALGKASTTLPAVETTTLYIKMQEKDNGANSATTGPITVSVMPPAQVDSTLNGRITGSVTLTSSKLYGLDGVVYVARGGTLRIPAGTVIFGDNANVSAICVNRGGKIYAEGTAQYPIVMTSPAPAGQRDRGDWGGLLIMGEAKTNLGEAPIEGGIADNVNSPDANGWFGGNNDDDNSGVLRYVRIEFSGIAESPDNETNGLTLGAVGRGTVIENIQVSWCGDDSYEWFGGTVNMKHIIAYNGIDDDFDSDNGYCGMLQFGISRRFNDIADQSNSEAYESDNDASSSENMPFTHPIFSNFTNIGGVMDTSFSAWKPGDDYSNKWNPKFLTACQIRRNSRMTLYNSVLVGWPGGVEMTNQNTVRAAEHDSLRVRYCDFYGIKNNKFFYFGSSTTASGTVDANWLSTNQAGNVFINGSGKIDELAMLENGFGLGANFNPLPESNATYLTTANFQDSWLSDSFFENVSYRGAFGLQRWDLPWAEYDPVNKVYTATAVEEVNSAQPKFECSIFPIPASSYVNVKYMMTNPKNVSIKMYNSVGLLISTFIENQVQTEGYYEFNINASVLPDGFYMLAIEQDDEIYTKPIVISK